MSFREDFDSILEAIRVNPKTSAEEFQRQVMPLIQFIRENTPERLFKFRACTSKNLSAFEKDEIWLSTAASFNDLHDSLLFFDKKSILSFIQEAFSTGLLLPRFKEQFEFLSNQQHLTPEFQQQAARALSSLNGTQSADVFMKALGDFELFLDQCFASLKDGVRTSSKMACLSESIKSPLMWAHYADNSKGFALGYDFRNNQVTQCSNCPNRSCNKFMSGTIYPVVYSDCRFDATNYGQWYVQWYLGQQLGIPTEELYHDSFLHIKTALHKSNDWAYENEWRIICSTSDDELEAKKHYPIKKQAVAIYFGCQISDKDKDILTTIADQKGIAKYQMKVTDYSSKYELDFEPM